MKLSAFLSGMLGSIAGLIFGFVLWGTAEVPPAFAHTSAGREDEIFATLRELRDDLDRQARSAHLSPVVPPVQSLKPSFEARLDRLEVELDEFRRQVRDREHLHVEDSTPVIVSADADEQVAALCKSADDVGSRLNFLTQREVRRRLGEPYHIQQKGEQEAWTYVPWSLVHRSDVDDQLLETEIEKFGIPNQISALGYMGGMGQSFVVLQVRFVNGIVVATDCSKP